MHSMMVTLWTHEPFAFPLYNASKHGDRSPSQLEMNMERAAHRVASGESVYIPCTIGHTNTFNAHLKNELIRQRDEGRNNVAREGVVEDGKARAMEAARKAKEEAREKVESVAEKDDDSLTKFGLDSRPAHKKKVKKGQDEETLARMRDQLGLFD